MYELIIFDVDGTLIDSKISCIIALHNIILRETGVSQPLQNIEYAFGYDGHLVMQDFHLPDSLISDWVDEEIKLASLSRPFNGIRETLEKLNEKNYMLGIATSKYRKELEPFLGSYDLLNYFDYSSCFDDVTYLKPDPETINRLVTQSKIPKENILFIGDSRSDMLCANNAEVSFALAGWGANDTVKSECKSTILTHPKDIWTLLA